MSEAKEKLLSVLRNDVWTPEQIADRILAAGFALPEKPKPCPVEEEAKRLWDLYMSHMPEMFVPWPTRNESSREGMRIVARDSLARQCEAYLAGVRDRCNKANTSFPCQRETCNNTSGCGDLQRDAKRKYGQEEKG